MTPHAQTPPAAVIDSADRRRADGVAVISFRRAWLTLRLHAAGVAVRHVVPQLGEPLLPAIRPPLLLDAASMPPRLLPAILRELGRMRPILTLALIAGDAPGLGQLVALAPAVQVVLSDTVPPATLALWLRMAPILAHRPVDVPPAWVGVAAPALPLPGATLDALYALAPYGAAPAASLTAAARRIGMSRRQLCYHLAALRAVVGIPRQRRYRPLALATAICQAITTPRPDGSEV